MLDTLDLTGVYKQLTYIASATKIDTAFHSTLLRIHLTP
jgi:hypothetical protein